MKLPLICFLFFLIAGSALRLFFGIDFTDEAYWVVMASRFARGAKPFVDELFINQTGAILLSPFLKLYYAFFSNLPFNEGLVLYTRGLYFLLALLVSLITQRTLRLRLSETKATLIACSVFAIVPLLIPNLGYNSLGSLLFTLGVSLLLRSTWSSLPAPKHYSAFAAGIVHALAAFAYPSLLIPILLAWAIQNRVWTYWVGMIVVTVSLAPVILAAGEKLSLSLIYTLTSFDHGGGFGKLGTVFYHFFVTNFRIRVGLVLLLPVAALFSPNHFLRTGLLLLFPFFFTLCFTDLLFSQMWFVFYFALLGCGFVKWHEKTQRDLLLSFWIPSFVAAVSIGWTSSSAPINGVLGMVPAFLASSLFLWEFLEKRTRLAPVIQGSFLVILVALQFYGKAFYRDGDFPQLNKQVQSGPYRYLFTTAHKFRYLSEISADVKRVENPEGRIVFYEFPAGYLLTPMPSGVNSTWIRDISRGKRFYANYYETRQNPSNRVFEILWLTHEVEKMQRVRYEEKDELHQFLKKTHSPLLFRENYVVLTPTNEPSKDQNGERAIH